MKRTLAVLIIAATIACGYQFPKLPKCVYTDSCPSPSPVSTPEPNPSPVDSPSPCTCPALCPNDPSRYESDDPYCRCEPPSESYCKPSPLPSPLPSAAPCVSPAAPCVKPEGCSSCAQYVAWALAGGHLSKLPNGLLYNDPGGNPALREYVDPKTCYLVWADGSLRNKRLHKDGTICSECPPAPSPAPCVTPSPSPDAPTPGPTPATCPALVRWGAGLHAQMTPDFQPVPKEPVRSGNTIEFDSTARFGGSAGGRGQACNSDHHAVCDAQGDDHGPNWRHCEDPRGPVWTVLDDCGAAKVKITNGGWGIQFVRVSHGTCRVKACPRPDVMDEEGQPVRVLGTGCDEGSAEVQ